jgi:phosphatidylglycerol:prolipoprotein diacylglycerol transferase
MDISRTGIELGPLTIHFYGVLIVLGIVAGANLTAWLAKKDHKDPEHVWNALVWAVIGGVIGARLWFVFFPPLTSVEAGKTTAWMLSHPFDMNDGPLAIWNGGLGIFGAVLGGLVAVLLYMQKHKIRGLVRWEWLDVAAMALPLGQFFGRWGNYVNQELYGRPTDLPWAISIDFPPPQYAAATGFHPLFLYEGLWNLALCGLMLWLWFNRRTMFKAGDFFSLYLIGYGFIRFWLEFLRIEVAEIQGLGVNSSQTASLMGLVIGLGLIFWRRQQTAWPFYLPVGEEKKSWAKKKNKAAT